MAEPTSPRFRFGGRVSLDFTWTLARRLWAPVEHLTRDDDVGEWLAAAELVDPQAPSAVGVLDQARELREAIYRSVHHRIAGELMDRADLRVVNRWAQEPQPRPTLGTDGSITWTADDPVRAGLGAVALDAVEVLVDGADRLRECSRDSCGALYYDASPAGRRRWCLAERCGNVVNTARYRDRTSRR